MWTEASTREAYGKTLLQLGKKDPNIVVLCADLSRSTFVHLFAKEFPNRFFDVGIAEQNMMGIAAGLAASGKTVFASTFAVFATTKAFDQIRMCIAQPKLNVKVVATHGGITVGQDGFSHHAIEDIALMCSLPGFNVIVPADAPEVVQVVETAAKEKGPFYIRLSRPNTPIVHTSPFTFRLGKAEVMREGRDATIIACGIMVAKALEASIMLSSEGIECQVLNMATIKPLDEEAIVKAAKGTGAIVVAEEHLQQGGLGSRVAQVVVQNYPVPMEFVALQDVFAESGLPHELLQKYGLDTSDIKRKIIQVVSKKRNL